MFYKHKYRCTWADIKKMMQKDFCKSQIRALISQGQLVVVPADDLPMVLDKLAA